MMAEQFREREVHCTVNGAILINTINNPAQRTGKKKKNKSARHQNLKIWRDPENRDEWAHMDLTRTNEVGAKTGSVTYQEKYRTFVIKYVMRLTATGPLCTTL